MKDNRWAMLCRLRVEAFNDPSWTWERKLDGDRLRVDIDAHCGIALTARSGAMKVCRTNGLCGTVPLQNVKVGECFMCKTGEAVYVKTDRHTCDTIGAVSLGSGLLYDYPSDKEVVPVESQVSFCRGGLDC